MTVDYSSSIDAALEVMRRHIQALNQSDGEALAATLHFPHYRLSASELKTWPSAESYLADFHQRAGSEWCYSQWGRLTPISAINDKVHLDVRVDRFRADGSLLTQFDSIWVLTCKNGIWAAQLRSTMALEQPPSI